MLVQALRDADASCGGKAMGLAKLLRGSGLPVPDGFVVTDRVFRMAVGDVGGGAIGEVGHALEEAVRRIAGFEVPAELRAEVAERARELGSRVAVRSSATIEDGEAGTAAGVYSSRVAVAVEEVWDAIRAVWASALTPLAAAYARGRASAIAVIVQEYVEGERVTVYT